MARRESDAEREQREYDEMMARIEADIQARKQREKARETFGNSPTEEELDRSLRQENKKVAKSMGLFSWFFGGADGTNESANRYEAPSEADQNAIRAQTSSSRQNTPAKPDDTLPPPVTVVRTETGRCDSEGYIYSVTYYSDGSEEWNRM